MGNKNVFQYKRSTIKSSVKANGNELTGKDFTTEEYRDFKPNATTVMKNGKKYQELFAKSMNEQDTV